MNKFLAFLLMFVEAPVYFISGLLLDACQWLNAHEMLLLNDLNKLPLKLRAVWRLEHAIYPMNLFMLRVWLSIHRLGNRLAPREER